MSFRFDASRLVSTLTAIEKRHVFAVQAYGESVGRELVKHAKTNRPWTDRTHSAKNRMDATQRFAGMKLRISLHGRMNYHVYLEFVKFKHKGRLSIFWPTIEAIQPQALEGWAKVVQK